MSDQKPVVKEDLLFLAEFYQTSANPQLLHGDQAAQKQQEDRAYGVVRLSSGQGKCLACGKVFSNFHNCRTHFREVHSGEQSEVHECHICGAKFGLARSKANHLMKKHGISQKMLKFAQVDPWNFKLDVCLLCAFAVI